VTSEAELKKLVHCTSIDFLCVYGCADCQQATLDQLQITQITDKESKFGYSLYLFNVSGIISLKPFGQVGGELSGGCYIRGVFGLETLDGLEQLSSIGVSNAGNGIVIAGNSNLWDATAMHTLIPEGHISVFENPELVCVPEEWPEADEEGRTIRANGECPSFR
jgi:hypothetical protein